MAKVRVYELAKELEIESKTLVDKLRASGLDVKNYMSTLDEDVEKKARDIVEGNKKISKVVEVVEKRIKPRIIRRRKKVVAVEKEEPAEKSIEESVEGPVEELAESDSEKVVDENIAIEATSIEKEVAPEEPVSEESESVEPQSKTKNKKSKKRKKDQPAKIIKKAADGPLKELLTKEKEKEEKKEDKKTSRRRPSSPVVKIPKQTQVLSPEEIKEESGKKKKDKKKTKKKDDNSKFNFRHRKVSVFEKADLYNGSKSRGKGKKKRKKGQEVSKKLKQTEITTPKAIKRRLKVQEEVTVAELAKAMGVKAIELMQKLITLGVMVNVNKKIDFETATLVADDFGYELELEQFEVESIVEKVEDDPENLKPRPPVVTIMGHVDHGKTSLLDYVRKSKIIDGESGGITQHIGAYYVKTKGGDIVFLDTPGHEAFTAMRARGASVTDLIILVVAADDGVMPQTKEAANHAKAAGIPIIVAINKMDKPEANPEKVTRELSEIDLAPEEWGGSTIYGKVSAVTGEGVDELMELILLQSEILELTANPDKPAKGSIIEAQLDKSKGPVATVLINGGTLNQGDHFICGESYGKVRAMLDQYGKKMKSAGPSVPVEIYGMSAVPMAGDAFVVVKDERSSRQLVEYRKAQIKSKEIGRSGVVSLDDLFNKIKEGEIKDLNIILKTDVQGTLEALSESMVKQSTSEVKLQIIHSSTGAITETDVMLATTSGAIIIGFNVRANPRVTKVAEKENVDIRYYNVIYNVLEDIRLAMTGLLDPVFKEKVIGRAEIKEIFNVPKIGAVAGCYVTDGYIERNSKARLLRDEVVIFEGNLASLKRFKGDVKEVQTGYECGMGLEGYQDIKPGDVFEVYQMEEVQAEL